MSDKNKEVTEVIEVNESSGKVKENKSDDPGTNVRNYLWIWWQNDEYMVNLRVKSAILPF